MKRPMKRLLSLLTIPLLLLSPESHGGDYVQFVRQVQMPDELEWDMSVEKAGNALSPLAINPNGARFELWAVDSETLASFLLDTTYVNSYIPVAEVNISTEDPYEIIPRTRVDRPFTVEITLNGLVSDPDAPEAAQMVKLLRHVQAYQGKGTGKNVNRGNATLISEGSLSENGDHSLEYPLTSIPGGDREKVRGEERFSVFSLTDENAPESILDSDTVQIWPMAGFNVEGISPNQLVEGPSPHLTVELSDLYPDSWTYLQVYQGSPSLGTDGVLVPGSSVLVDGTIPHDESLTVKDLDSVVRKDGSWTLELVTVTPFGAERLWHTTFQVKRSVRVNSAITTVQ